MILPLLYDRLMSDMCNVPRQVDRALQMQMCNVDRRMQPSMLQLNAPSMNCIQIHSSNIDAYRICCSDWNSQSASVERNRVDLFELLDRLYFPDDPIREWTKRKVQEINDRYKEVESLLW